MRTLEAVIEKEVRSHVDESELCQSLVMEGTKDPGLYDDIINKAGKIVEELIRNNLEFIINLAAIEEDDEEEEFEETRPITNISTEDEEMLRFIED